MEINAENLKGILEKENNIILRGAPGTGKSYLSKEIANLLITSKNSELEKLEVESRIGFVQFHPSYDYTDFVEGLKPTISDSGEMRFELKDGVFKEFVNRAKKDLNNNYVFIIDEINRGEISKIFGELFYSIDPGYRGKEGEVSTQYSLLGNKKVDYVIDNTGDNKKILTWYKEDEVTEKFYIPKNVYIIGTMNDIDRSVDTFDFAMRRRFSFIEVTAKDSVENMGICEELGEKIKDLNKYIESEENDGLGLGRDYQIGAAYFKKLNDGIKDKEGKTIQESYKDSNRKDELLKEVWNNKLEPLLKEYLRGEPSAEAKLEKMKKLLLGTQSETKSN